jgi:hypothetical protein
MRQEDVIELYLVCYNFDTQVLTLRHEDDTTVIQWDTPMTITEVMETLKTKVTDHLGHKPIVSGHSHSLYWVDRCSAESGSWIRVCIDNQERIILVRCSHNPHDLYGFDYLVEFYDGFDKDEPYYLDRQMRDNEIYRYYEKDRDLRYLYGLTIALNQPTSVVVDELPQRLGWLHTDGVNYMVCTHENELQPATETEWTNAYVVLNHPTEVNVVLYEDRYNPLPHVLLNKYGQSYWNGIWYDRHKWLTWGTIAGDLKVLDNFTYSPLRIPESQFRNPHKHSIDNVLKSMMLQFH